LILPEIVAFAKKVTTESREKMRLQAVIGIDDTWNDRRNGPVSILDMVHVGSRRVVDSDVVQKGNASGPGDYQRSSNGMEVEALSRMVKRWEDDQRVAVVVTDQDSKIAKVIRESRWNGNTIERWRLSWRARTQE
jgi:hypothetical protein